MKATTFRYGQFLILLGDGAVPEVFTDPCGVNSRGFNRTTNMNETETPDCDDPDAVAWLERDARSKSAELPIAGVVADESFDTYDAWFESGASKNVRVEMGARVWEGAAKIANLNVQGERGQRINFTASLVSDGPFLRVP
jgi:predicted secreted protein